MSARLRDNATFLNNSGTGSNAISSATLTCRIFTMPKSRSKITQVCCAYLIFIVWLACKQVPVIQTLQSQPAARPNEDLNKPPTPIQSSSYVSLDGLTLVIVFDKPVNLSASIESVEQRRAAALSTAASSTKPLLSTTSATELQRQVEPASTLNQTKLESLSSNVEASNSRVRNWQPNRRSPVCYDEDELGTSQGEAPNLIEGVQLCAQTLTKKTLKLLRKFKLFNCIWSSRIQFIIQLGKPIPAATPTVRIAFQRRLIVEYGNESAYNERELGVDLGKLPLESLGVPLEPRLALTGPNQVPACGRFSLSAHLSSPFGTYQDESVRLSWSVERLGLITTAASPHQSTDSLGNNRSNSAAPVSPSVPGAEPSQDNGHRQLLELVELRWQRLQQLVTNNRGSNLLLDAQLLQFSPQKYEIKVSATFMTSLTSVTLNASHQVARLDFEAPIGTIYGSHILAQEKQLNPNRELALLADIQVPSCAQNVKQVGLYWQVNDPRVQFEQSYAPIYVAKSNSLPEQALIEFRLNLFYGIRVKKFASASTFISTGDSVLEAQISDGLLMASLGRGQVQDNFVGDRSFGGGRQGAQQQQQQLELYATHGANVVSDPKRQPQQQQQQQQQQGFDKYTYQWSCFDGKTAQQCQKSLKLQAASNGTRYDLGGAAGPSTNSAAGLMSLGAAKQNALADQQANKNNNLGDNLLLVDKPRQRQPVLRIPYSWLESDAQLWFGLQRFDRHNPSQHSKTEFALVSVRDEQATGLISIGPVFIGRPRHRATLRNPLTGAVILPAEVPAFVVGRLGPSARVVSFQWRLLNYPHPLHWTVKNATNQLTGQEELVTELHLNPQSLVAHSQLQVQLVACTKPQQIGSGSSSASLNFDIVGGVSQCRVELVSTRNQSADQQQQIDDEPLVVSVEFCNIPLGLSPITYQLYLIDTSASDGFIEANRPQLDGTNSSGQQQSDAQMTDDYLNEADEVYLASQAQAVSVPQLSPLFTLADLSWSTLSLLSSSFERAKQSAGAPTKPQTNTSLRVRFGVRVCDRLQSCRMFYSRSVDPIGRSNETLIQNQLGSASNSISRQAASGQQMRRKGLPPVRQRQQVNKLLRNMIESSRRANLVGNSVAAIAVLNSVLTLGHQLLTVENERVRRLKLDSDEKSAYDQDVENNLDVLEQQQQQLKDLVDVATRDCLHYGAQSLQRQFHYAESGQTILALNALTSILSSPTSNIEFKFRAIRLISQLNKLTIELALESRVNNPVADLKTIRSTFESLFGVFNQHSVESSRGANGDHDAVRKSNHRHKTNGHRPVNNSTADTSLSGGRANFSSINYATLSPTATTNQVQSLLSTTAVANKSTKKKREEAISTYLKAIRQAHRSLIRAAAIQLPLGSFEQLEYQTEASQDDTNPAEQRANADIVSSLTHQTDLLSDSIDVDLHEFGTLSIQFDKERKLFDGKLRTQINQAHLRCRNDTTTKCSSFVLAVSSFAGKAPFRALDSGQQLRVPILQLDWLSPIDGSSLIDSMKTLDGLSNSDAGLTLKDFAATVTFAIPDQVAEKEDKPSSEDLSSQQTNLRPYRCFRFDEDLNEWALIEQPDEQAVDSQPVEGERRIRCAFDGFGTVGAFRGQPPVGETPTELTIALLVLSVLTLVTIISLLGCLASRNKQKRRNRSPHASGSFDSDVSTPSKRSYSDESISETSSEPAPAPLQHQRTAADHQQPGLSTRLRDQFKYPLAGLR